MENLAIYNKHKQPPEWAIKEIQAGRLRGKSDINPQWRIEALTEMFGVIGFGWKYEIINLWTVPTGDEVLAFAHIHMFVKHNGEWSDAIVGTGGSMMVAIEKNGAYNSDECYKMAISDAISVCSKQLGIGAAIYSGSKYPTTPPTKQEQPKVEAPKAEAVKITKQELLNGIGLVKDRAELTKLYKQYKAIIDADKDLMARLKEISAKYLEKK